MKFYNTKLEIPEDYLQPEIRKGCEVSTELKKVWVIQMDLYKELERVCDKYNIKIYANSGTLLGAIREGGFIPWDDDMDFALLRKDYEKLLRVAPKEFKHPYFLQTAYNDDHCFRGHAQLRNSETTAICSVDKGMPYNKGIFIDIFPFDNMPDGKLERKILRVRALFTWALLLFSYYNPNIMDNKPYAKIIYKILKPFYKLVDYRKVYRHYEKICSGYNRKKTRKQEQIAFFQGRECELAKYGDHSADTRVPFEFTDIRVPKRYKSVLVDYYGPDYMTPINSGSYHGEVFFDPERPYTYYE